MKIACLSFCLAASTSVRALPDPVWWNGFEYCEEPVVLYVDADLDGWGGNDYSILACGPWPPGFSTSTGDCDDGNPAVHPGAFDGCDGVDNDCDGKTDDDHVPLGCYEGPPGTLGVGICAIGSLSCLGAAGTQCTGQVLPQPEILDGIDNNCNGLIDEGFELICNDNIDNDDDGLTDCDDPDCAASPHCPP